MQKHMGQSITRYDKTELACRAYLKAMIPANIQAAFKKTGILPLERTIISKEKVFPCESFTFREEKPAEKLAAIKSGKEAVQVFIRLKMESSKSTPNDEAKCMCHKRRKLSVKPKPGGRAITDDVYIEDLHTYGSVKEDISHITTKKINPIF
jgi:hypothetical protein